MIQKAVSGGDDRRKTVRDPCCLLSHIEGTEPVLDWLRGLTAADKRVIGTDLSTVQFGWPIGMPLCRPLGDGLWEVRSSLSGGRITRLLFFVDKGRIGVVHGFFKKTQKTPPIVLALAQKRMKEMQA